MLDSEREFIGKWQQTDCKRDKKLRKTGWN